jgi:plastocyanin
MITTRKSHALLTACALLTTAALSLAACGGGEQPAPAPTAGAPAEAPAAPAAAPAAGAPASGPSGTATVTGTVTYSGEVPNLRPVNMGADPACAAKHTAPVANSALVLGEGQTLGNVFVYVKSGLPAGTWTAPGTPAVIDQRGCIYDPHVLGVMQGQEVKFLNSDGILHNVHALPAVNQEFNMAMPANRTEASHTFPQAEEMFTIKCDVHPWMNAKVRVMEHPFFATSTPDGKFTIANLPAGTYEIEAWHERLGTQTQTVTVGDGGSATADFTMERSAGSSGG